MKGYMTTENISQSILDFLSTYDAKRMDALWQIHRSNFRKFWHDRILLDDGNAITDSESDEVVRILDRNGKGNTKGSEAVAKAMVPQGAWRRMFKDFKTNRDLGKLVYSVLECEDKTRKSVLIDELYRINEGQGNHLTGKSANTISAMLAAYDPEINLSVISLNDRRALMRYLGIPLSDAARITIGAEIVESNEAIQAAMRARGLDATARTVTNFLYSPNIKILWKEGHTIKRAEGSVNVVVPTMTDEEEQEEQDVETKIGDEVRESMQIQGLIAQIGTSMGFRIWLPKADRSRVLKVWTPEPGELLDELPLGYDSTTTETIAQIDVLWLRQRSIVRAFEVEHTTSVYSGLLRMADLVALQPNINVKLHIVAPAEKREKVLKEIRRPVFSLLEGRALAEMCTYLSYDQVKEIGAIKHLIHMSDKVIDEYEETAE